MIVILVRTLVMLFELPIIDRLSNGLSVDGVLFVRVRMTDDRLRPPTSRLTALRPLVCRPRLSDDIAGFDDLDDSIGTAVSDSCSLKWLNYVRSSTVKASVIFHSKRLEFAVTSYDVLIRCSQFHNFMSLYEEQAYYNRSTMVGLPAY